MKTRKFLRLILGLFLCIAPLSAFADGLILADLLKPGASIQVDDKIFYDFRDFSGTATGANASPLTPGQIRVVPYTATINGAEEIGLRFQSASFFAGPSSSQDTSYKYNVTTVSGLDVIDDSFLRVLGTGIIGNGSLTVEATATDENGIAVAPKLVITEKGPIFVQASFDPQDILIISKDILLAGSATGSAAFSSVVDQLYSQTPIPEPSCMFSFGAGLLGLFGFLRKRLFRK